jgi:hypothetical protein
LTGSRSRSRSALAALALVAAAAQVAHAATWVEFTFEGTVTLRLGENPDHPWGHVQVGDPMSFSYVIDIDQPDQSSDPSYGRYDVASAVLTYGGVSLVPDSIDSMIVNLNGSNGADEIDFAMEPFGELPGDAAIFTLVGGVTTLPDDSIPIDFDLTDFFIRGVGYGDGIDLNLGSQFDSYSYQIIPAPGAFVILGASFFRLGGRRRSRRH